jgi:hypothetical protein
MRLGMSVRVNFAQGSPTPASTTSTASAANPTTPASS